MHQTKSAPSTTTTTSKLTSGKTEKGKSSLGNTTQTASSSSNPTQNKSGKTAKLSDKLRKDGKLTADECKHRFNQGLCMFCGGSGHKAKECPKSGFQCHKSIFFSSFVLSNPQLDYILSYVLSYLCISSYNSLDLCIMLCMLPPLMS